VDAGRRIKNWLTVFRAKHHVVFAREENVPVRSEVRHSLLYT
jgi:hypothetical protein